MTKKKKKKKKKKKIATVSDNNVRCKQPGTNLRSMVTWAFTFGKLKKLAFNTPKNSFVYFNTPLKNIPYIHFLLKQATPPSISI